MSVKMGKNYISPTSLLVIYGSIALKTTWSVSYKMKCVITIQPSNYALRKGIKLNENLCSHKKTVHGMNIHSSFIHNNQQLQQWKRLYTGEWLNKPGYTHYRPSWQQDRMAYWYLQWFDVSPWNFAEKKKQNKTKKELIQWYYIPCALIFNFFSCNFRWAEKRFVVKNR